MAAFSWWQEGLPKVNRPKQVNRTRNERNRVPMRKMNSLNWDVALRLAYSRTFRINIHIFTLWRVWFTSWRGPLGLPPSRTDQTCEEPSSKSITTAQWRTDIRPRSASHQKHKPMVINHQIQPGIEPWTLTQAYANNRDFLVEVNTRQGCCHRQSLPHNRERAIILGYKNLKLMREQPHRLDGIWSVHYSSQHYWLMFDMGFSLIRC